MTDQISIIDSYRVPKRLETLYSIILPFLLQDLAHKYEVVPLFGFRYGTETPFTTLITVKVSEVSTSQREGWFRVKFDEETNTVFGLPSPSSCPLITLN